MIELSEEYFERERAKSRIKFQRDQLSRLHSAYLDGFEEGFEPGEQIGRIQFYQKRLNLPLTPFEQLRAWSLDQLQETVRHLEQQLTC